MNSSKRLLEWLDSNGNKVSLNNTVQAQAQLPQQTNDRFKERFMKLAKHIEDIHDWSLISYITEYELELEYTSASGATHTLSIDVNSKNIKVDLVLSLFGQKIATLEAGHNEWSRVLNFLKDMKVIQDTKLCEWMDNNGNTVALNSANSSMSTNGTTTKKTSYKDEFTKLAKHLKDTHWHSLVSHCTDTEVHIDFWEFQEPIQRIIIEKPINYLRLKVFNNGGTNTVLDISCKTWDEVLQELEDIKVIKDKRLCESISLSTIDSFKIYENLWKE